MEVGEDAAATFQSATDFAARLVAEASAAKQEAPSMVWYSLDDALDLLATLEDARDALIESGHLSVVMPVETQIRELSRRLDFDDPQGDPDA